MTDTTDTTARVYRAREINPAKRYMMEYRAILHRRDALQEHYDRLTSLGPQPMAGIVLRGDADAIRTNNPEAARLQQQDGLQRELDELRAHLDEALAARLLMIERLSDERYKTLCTMRYINGWGWGRIARGMGYCVDDGYLFKLHGRALNEIRCMLKVDS